MTETPLYTAIAEYARQKTSRFHMPGHKGHACGFLPAEIAALDVTELAETDNLRAPQGAIRAAEEAMARATGAKHTYFLTGGSTVGILAMVTAIVGRGKTVLVDRGCHVSVFSALSLCGAVPKYIYPSFDTSIGAYSPLTASAVAAALQTAKDPAAVLLTSPNAFGQLAEVGEIAALCHQRNIPLLVDEAHGAHFAFSDALPKGALACGADCCVQSMHKTLPALTGAALLQVGNSALTERFGEALRLFHTTSPSYLIMASMDCARVEAAQAGERLAALAEIVGHHAPENVVRGALQDPLRITVRCDGEAAERLCRAANIVPEMTSTNYAVFIVTMADTPDAVPALLKLASTFTPPLAAQPIPPVAPPILTPAAAFEAKGEQLTTAEAVGRIAKEPLLCYPPGIALLAPGEQITLETASYLQNRGVQSVSVCVQ